MAAIYLLCGDRGLKGFCILDAEQQPAPSTRSRYTALYLTNTPGRRSGLHLAHSDDGLHWLAYEENSRAIRADALSCPVKFAESSLQKLRGHTIRLRIQLSRASVYGLAFS